MRETYAAMGGISEMLPSAQSSFVRILMVLHESAGLCFWISRPVGFYNELKFLSWLEKASFTTPRFGMGRGLEKLVSGPNSLCHQYFSPRIRRTPDKCSTRKSAADARHMAYGR